MIKFINITLIILILSTVGFAETPKRVFKGKVYSSNQQVNKAYSSNQPFDLDKAREYTRKLQASVDANEEKPEVQYYTPTKPEYDQVEPAPIAPQIQLGFSYSNYDHGHGHNSHHNSHNDSYSISYDNWGWGNFIGLGYHSGNWGLGLGLNF